MQGVRAVGLRDAMSRDSTLVSRQGERPRDVFDLLGPVSSNPKP